MTSVLQDWVMELPLRAQGTLLTGIRGCDLAPKVPCDIDERYGCSTGESSAERHLVAFLRYCVLNPADEREVDHPGAWFQSSPPPRWKPSQLGHYPLHWFSHLMHCFEVVGYMCPDGGEPGDAWRGIAPSDSKAHQAYLIYERMALSMHLNPETPEQQLERLTEDRIATGTVVS